MFFTLTKLQTLVNICVNWIIEVRLHTLYNCYKLFHTPYRTCMIFRTNCRRTLFLLNIFNSSLKSRPVVNTSTVCFLCYPKSSANHYGSWEGASRWRGPKIYVWLNFCANVMMCHSLVCRTVFSIYFPSKIGVIINHTVSEPSLFFTTSLSF